MAGTRCPSTRQDSWLRLSGVTPARCVALLTADERRQDPDRRDHSSCQQGAPESHEKRVLRRDDVGGEDGCAPRSGERPTRGGVTKTGEDGSGEGHAEALTHDTRGGQQTGCFPLLPGRGGIHERARVRRLEQSLAEPREHPAPDEHDERGRVDGRGETLSVECLAMTRTHSFRVLAEKKLDKPQAGLRGPHKGHEDEGMRHRPRNLGRRGQHSLTRVL